MDKSQRVRYEMSARVRNFGLANSEVFPESSAAGQVFALVAAAVAAVEGFLTERETARAEARKVKAHTRGAVANYMKALAATGRRVARAETGTNPFRMPARKSAPVILAKARFFMGEAEKRKAQFIRLGMPENFVEEFRVLVGNLEHAVQSQQDGRASLRKTQAGIETALKQAHDAILDLDVIVANVLRADPVRLAHYEGARRIEGLASGEADPEPDPMPTSTSAEEPATARPPAGETNPAAADVDPLRKVS